MREIKFRYYQAPGDGDTEWNKQEHTLQDIESGQFDSIILAQKKYYRIHGPFQFTGLKDKNGKEIYEGDIVLYEPDYIKLRQKPAEVRWEDHGWSPFLYSGGGEFEPSYCTVIGNIFEHPELLEK